MMLNYVASVELRAERLRRQGPMDLTVDHHNDFQA